MGSDRIVLKDSDRVVLPGAKAASHSAIKGQAVGIRKSAWVFPPLAPPEPAAVPEKPTASRRPAVRQSAAGRGVFATFVSPRLFAATISRSSAIAMLLVAAFFWGAGNVANKTVLAHIDAFTAVTLRCGLAALVILPFARAETNAPRLPGWLGSAAAVALLFAASLILQQMAYQWTSVTNASFLVNTCTVLTPLLAWALLSERQSKRIIFAAPAILPVSSQPYAMRAGWWPWVATPHGMAGLSRPVLSHSRWRPS